MTRFSFDDTDYGVHLEGEIVGRWNGFPIVKANAEGVVRFFNELDSDNLHVSIVGSELHILDDYNDVVDDNDSIVTGAPYVYPIDSEGCVTLDGLVWNEFADATTCADALAELSPAERGTLEQLAAEIAHRTDLPETAQTLAERVAWESCSVTVSDVVSALWEQVDASRTAWRYY